MINATNLCAGYSKTEVLHKFNLDVTPGSWDVILGPNGSGKTTFIKVLMGQLSPSFLD